MELHEGEPLRHVGDLPAMAAPRYGEKAAFSFYADELSYAALEERSDRMANALLDRGLDAGDRVGVMIPNTNEFPVAYFGAIKAGGVPTPLNLRMDPETLVYVLNDAGANHLLGSQLIGDEVAQLAAAAAVEHTLVAGGGEGLEDLEVALADASPDLDRPPRRYDDVACQPYTSGTTGRPKGVLLTHENLLTTIEAYDKGGLGLDAEDSFLLVLPLFHIYALNALMGTGIYSGTTMYLQPTPEPVPMLRAIEDNRITKFAGVPAMYTTMFREYRRNPGDYDLSSLEDVTCAAAPLADETRRTIEESWDVPMVEGWGMTETAPAGTVEPSRGVRKAAGCVGPPVYNVELKIADPATRETIVAPEDLSPHPNPDIDFDDHGSVTGEIAIRGPNVFEGYYNRPEKTREVFDDEGWFYTEDVARVDRDGYFWIVDRADDMIIAGGENIYPAEVENALYEHPAVAEAAVVGVPHETKGEAPVAFVVLEEGEAVSEADLRRFTLDHVATYAHPRRVFFVDDLPRSATQKVQRYKLEEAADERLDGPLAPSEEL